MTLTRARLTSILAVLGVTLAAVAAILVGPAPAADATTTYSSGSLAAVPNLNRGERGLITVKDDGAGITVTGTMQGGQPTTSYVSLLYTDDRCSVPEPTASLTVADGWDNQGVDYRSYQQTYQGDAYRAVKGHIGSVSVRAITQAINAQAGGNFLLTAEARACADITPNA